MTDISQKLEQALRDSLDQVELSSKRKDETANAISANFFKQWFIHRGRSYHFLFRKNLRVTSIQFAELLALLKVHTRKDDGGPAPSDLQFLSVDEFRYSVKGIVEAFADGESAAPPPFKAISGLYSDLLCRIVVVRYFYGSCAVYVPPHLDLDIETICGKSGYIHSCGRQVFARNVLKAKKEHLFEAVSKHISTYLQDRRTFFAAYAHEDFTDFDREKAAILRDGLDDVKIYVEKFYFGEDRLVSVLNEMRTRFGANLEIPAPGNFREVHQRLRDLPGVDKTRTLWLIVDRSVGDQPGTPGDDRFYIVYDQTIENTNPFLLFDENKPGWFAHTTLPHSLAAAMLNVTRPDWNSDAPTIVDPFAGTGTVFFEALKFPHATLKCSDLSPIASQVFKDNLQFFTNNYTALQDIENKLQEVCAQLTPLLAKKKEIDINSDSENQVNIETMLPSEVTAAAELHRRCIKMEAPITFHFPKDVLTQLTHLTLIDRIFFYIALRASIRNDAALERQATDWRSAYSKECATLLYQTSELLKQRKREESQILANSSLEDGHAAPLAFFQSSYSTACTLSTQYIEERGEGSARVLGDKNALSLPKNSADVIITDPPYGINTEDGVVSLARLYAEVLAVLIAALKPNGHLVLCLPDKSFTGRRSPFFTHKELITSQILAIASNQKRRVFRPLTAFPVMGPIGGPPYYWESERALRRAILHFQFS